MSRRRKITPDLFAPLDTALAMPVRQVKRPEPRYYQVDVLGRARRRLGRGVKRLLIQGETGSGKTVLAGELTRCAVEKSNRVLFIADRRRLIGQAAETFSAFGIKYGVIMAGATEHVNRQVLLASRDTLNAWARNQLELPTPNIIIVDEAHKSMGETFQRILAYWPDAYVIGLTATPARADGKSLETFWQAMECTVPASQLIREGWLIEPEVWCPMELARRRKGGEDTKGLAGDPVSHWLRHAEGLPTIGFAGDIDEAKRMAEVFRSYNIPSESIDGSADDAERFAAFDRLANGRTLVLWSVGLLIEGVDIPEASAVIIWDKFGSIVKWRQACGRIMRPCPRINKTRCVVLDHSGAAGIHGPPGVDIPWSLDPAVNVGDELNRQFDEGKQPKPVLCSGCGKVYVGLPACPSCGRMAPRAEKKKPSQSEAYKARDEVLSKLTDEAAKDIQFETRQRYWKKCIYSAIHRNSKASAAVAMFRRTYNIWPEEAGVGPTVEYSGEWQRPAAEVWPEFVKQRSGAA